MARLTAIGVIGCTMVFLVAAVDFKKPIPLDFGDAIIVPTGESPYFVVSADFNHDGWPDLATSNTISHSVTVFLNKGNGTFGPGKSYPTLGLTPYALAAGDIDGDGNIDLVCGNMFSVNLTVFLNAGDGTFRPAHHLAADPGPMFTALADFDNDGKLDIATCNIGHDDVTVLLNRGSMNFEKKGPHRCNGVVPYSIVAADFNKDGKVDLATGNIYSSNVSVLISAGGGEFKEAVTYKTASLTQILFAADLNNDGYPDIVSGNGGSDNVSVLINDGHGKFKPTVNYDVKLPQGVTVGDINNDGFPDIVTANQSANTTSVLLNKGDGTFSKAIDFPVGSLYPTGVVIADLNKDGKPDIITANSGSNNISILLNGVHMPKVMDLVPPPNAGAVSRNRTLVNPIRAIFNTLLDPGSLSAETVRLEASESGPQPTKARWQPESRRLEIVPASGIARGRFFAGEEVKLRFSTGLTSNHGLSMKNGFSSSFYIEPEGGSGRFVRQEEFGGGNYNALVTADLDGDGKLDLIAAPKLGDSIQIFFNAGQRPAGEPVTLKTGGFDPTHLLIADFDEDGLPDIAVLNRVSATIAIFRNVGGRSFAPMATLKAPSIPVGLVMLDFDGDGRTDLASVGEHQPGVMLYSNRGGGHFEQTVRHNLSVKPAQLIAVDFDRDGLDDLVVLVAGSSRVVMLRNSGEGKFIKKDDVELDAGAVQSLVARDLNEDGAADFIAIHSLGEVKLYFNNGDGTVGKSVAVPARHAQRVIAADLNADGKVDLLIATREGVDALLNIGAGRFELHNAWSGGPVNALVAGDFRGAGSIDLAVSARGKLMFFANEARSAASTSVPTVAAAKR